MMDPKMAIHVLQCGSWWDSLLDDISDADMNPLQAALDAAIDALEKECQKIHLPDIPSTKADRIRAMADNELAEYLCGFTYCCECNHRNNCDGDNGYLKWLQQPAEEGRQ